MKFPYDWGNSRSISPAMDPYGTFFQKFWPIYIFTHEKWHLAMKKKWQMMYQWRNPRLSYCQGPQFPQQTTTSASPLDPRCGSATTGFPTASLGCYLRVAKHLPSAWFLLDLNYWFSLEISGIQLGRFSWFFNGFEIFIDILRVVFRIVWVWYSSTGRVFGPGLPGSMLTAAAARLCAWHQNANWNFEPHEAKCL